MKMKLTVTVAFFACLLLFGSAQKFTGGQLANLETGRLTVNPTNVESIESFSRPLTRSNAFTSSTQEFFIATALTDFGSQSLDFDNTLSIALHIEVLNERLSGSTFHFDIDLGSSYVNNQDRANVTHISFSYIIIGELFSGDPAVPDSSFIFARNGELNVYTDAATVYDFQNGAKESPFNWDATTGENCGAIQDDDNQWLLDPSTCQSILAQVYITGFEEHEISQGTDDYIDAFIGQLNDVGLNPFDLSTGDVVFSPDQSLDGLVVDFNTPDTDFITHIQLSMIVVAVRDYDPSGYPINQLVRDTFIVSFGPVISERDLSDSDLTSFSEPDPSAVPYLPDFNDQEKAGHRFCGLTAFRIDEEGSNNVAQEVNSFLLLDIDLINQEIDIELPTFPDGLGGDFNVIDDDTDTELFYSCLMLTARNSCDEVTNILEVNSAVDSFSVVQVPVGTDNTAAFGGPLAADTNSYQDLSEEDPNYIDFTIGDYSMVDMEMVREEESTVTFTFTYENVQNRGIEGVLHVYLPNNIIPNANPAYNQTIKVTVFGNEVYNGISAIDSFTTIHFSFFHYDPVPANGFGTVVIEYSSDYVGTALPINIQFGLIDHENVINDAGQCDTECSEIDGYTSGINYNTVPPTCIQCDTSFNIEFSAPNGTCSCAENFVQVDGFCVNCEIPLCAECNVDLDYCFQCVDNADYINENSKILGCQCETGFYRDDIECLECSAGCVTCTTGNACDACVPNDNTRLTPAENCECKDGFFENGQPVCGTCNPECLTCEGTAENCATCDTAGNFIMSGTTCVCRPGFALVLATDGSASCVPCDETCATCRMFQPDFCLTCRDADFRELIAGGVCDCIDGYFEINGVCVDTSCQEIDPDCQSCGIILSTGQAICRSCASPLRVLSADNLTCICKIGYYEDNGECLPCGEGCQSCTSPTVCTECAISARPNGDGTCECPTSYYVQETLGKLFCQPCSSACLECSGTPDFCSNCAQGFILNGNSCVCPSGTYLSADQTSCRACTPGCESCTGPTCDVCLPDFILNAGACTLDCPIGTFNAGVECRQCADYCRSCVSSISCRSCVPGHFLFAGSCRTSCPDGTFALSNICIACQQPCATCSGNAFTCRSCADGYILHNNQCLTECPTGLFFNGQSCQACSTNCLNCLSTANNCISCPANKFLVNGQCFDSCPYFIGQDGKCTDNCPTGFFLNGQNCAPCQGSCKTCSAAYTCLSCVGNLFAYNGQCLASCPAATLTIGSSCVDCHTSCVGCARSPVECIKCANGYYRLQERCVTQCPEGTYLEASTGFCRQCDSGCKTCTGPGNCLACFDGVQNPAVNQCGNTCGTNCLICQDNVCSKCAEGTISIGPSCSSYCPSGSRPVNGVCVCSSGFLHRNACVASCPAGFVGIDGECKACTAPCATCTGTVDRCATCQTGFALEQATGKCVTNQPCPYGRYRSMFGDCRVICPVGSYYNDLACFPGGCPIGYVIDQENRACIKQTIDTGCTIPNFLQGTRCVLNCDPGFFADTTTRVCKPCSSNCYTCPSANLCISCDEGFSLTNGACVAAEACSTGLVRYNGNCLTSCPSGFRNSNGFCLRQCASGYYYWNNGCYETCPTGLRTQAACVIVCPVGTVKNGNVCEAPTVACGTGQFYNTVIGACDICRFPCAECQGTSTTCTACSTGFVVSQTTCVRQATCLSGQYQSGTTCLACPEKCSTCSSATVCTACNTAAGYIVIGNDCARNTNQLQPVSLQVLEKSKRGTTVFIKLQATILPNSLPTNIASNILLLVPENNSGTPVITNWINGGFIYSAITYTGAIPTNAIYLIMNSALVGDIYRNMGYTTTNTFVQENITPNLPEAPATLVIPPTASNSKALDAATLGSNSKVFNSALRSVVANAIKGGNVKIGK